jgi:hypothetical protein
LGKNQEAALKIRSERGPAEPPAAAGGRQLRGKG